MAVDRGPVPRGEYGVDAPYVPAWLGGGGVVLLGVSVLSIGGGPLFLAPLLAGLLMLAMAASYLYTTRRGKFVAWAAILRQLQLTGDEKVLDIGCGRGAVLLAVARVLTTGHAVGIDLWRSLDQSGNDPRVTQRNAGLEGVEDRVRLETGDMTGLPFGDGTFDVVLSSLAIHNVSDGAGRARALHEAVRVLRPGGRLLIADIRHTDQYAEQLRAAGMTMVARRNLGWRFWYGGPWVSTQLVTAMKPQAPEPG